MSLTSRVATPLGGLIPYGNILLKTDSNTKPGSKKPILRLRDTHQYFFFIPENIAVCPHQQIQNMAASRRAPAESFFTRSLPHQYIHTYTWYEGRVLRPVKFLVPYFELGKLISYICDSGIISSVIASKYENDIGLNKVSVRILKKMR